MKIAFLIEQPFDPDAGGVQRVTSNLATIFKQKGHKVLIISTNTSKVDCTFWNEIPIHSIDIEKIKGQELNKFVVNKKITVIINQVGYSYYLTKKLKKYVNHEIKLINNLHINPLNFYDNNRFLITDYLKKKDLLWLNNLLTQKIILGYHIIKQYIELNYIIKNADAFVMLSERYKPELFKLGPGLIKYKNKIYSINNPAEIPTIDFSDLKKENIILFVGRLNVVQKRVDLLLQIWQKLHAKLPGWQFWVVGDGPERVFMENFCNENKLVNVKFFGTNKPDEFYKKTRIFHLTSAFEGFPLVLIEAQSFGCVPILFNSYSAANDVVTHNENGLSITPFNVDEYVNATLELANDANKLNSLKMNALRSVDRFSYESTYLKWESLFKKLIDGH